MRAEQRFREQRISEPLEDYLDVFDTYQAKVEDFLETTLDLANVEEEALAILGDPQFQEILRYLAAPPISADDLKVVAQVRSLSARTLAKHPELVERIVETVKLGLDRRRFPWVSEDRDPTEAERHAAVVASAALIAAQRVATSRRNEGKKEQEAAVRDALLAAKFKQLPTKPVAVIQDAPKPGEFCMEALFGERKADLLIGLWDRRIMPVECKVSNSASNSIKRLTNDTAVKAVRWREQFGATQVVPAAVLSGVYPPRHLEGAQAKGLTLFWAHDLGALTTWIESTRPTARGKTR
jgi:hypothetical protein